MLALIFGLPLLADALPGLFSKPSLPPNLPVVVDPVAE